MGRGALLPLSSTLAPRFSLVLKAGLSLLVIGRYAFLTVVG